MPDPLPDLSSALHVTNGDCTDLRGTGLADRVLVWFDVLHEGPVPDVADDEWRRMRSRFLTRASAPGSAEFVLERFRERDKTLTENRNGTYVLWFEADLYDQLQLVQILARLDELNVPPERISLICIGEYPGIARFGGLGELSAEQLRHLPGTKARSPLTRDALELASRAWSAIRAPRPEALAELLHIRNGVLRFLGEAVDRLCREYPSTRDGLSLTERRILAATAELTASMDSRRPLAHEVFSRAAGREARPFLGDTWAFAAMDRLARAPVPLLVAEPAGPVAATSTLAVTQAGLDVLAGSADQLELNGIDRWVGGVALKGRSCSWRFDEGTETITGSGSFAAYGRR